MADLQLAPPVAIDTRQPQDGTLKKGLHRPWLNAIIPNLTAAGSLPDGRAVPFSSRLSRYTVLWCTA